MELDKQRNSARKIENDADSVFNFHLVLFLLSTDSTCNAMNT